MLLSFALSFHCGIEQAQALLDTESTCHPPPGRNDANCLSSWPKVDLVSSLDAVLLRNGLWDSDLELGRDFGHVLILARIMSLFNHGRLGVINAFDARTEFGIDVTFSRFSDPIP